MVLQMKETVQTDHPRYDLLVLSRIRSLIHAFDIHSRRLNSPSPLDERLSDALSSLPRSKQARIADSLLHLVRMIEAPQNNDQASDKRRTVDRREESA